MNAKNKVLSICKKDKQMKNKWELNINNNNINNKVRNFIMFEIIIKILKQKVDGNICIIWTYLIKNSYKYTFNF